MNVAISIPGIIAAVGALVYGVVPGKAAELGRIAFGAGLLAVLMHVR